MNESSAVGVGVMPRAALAARPVVLIDGVPEPGLSVVEYRAEAPLDTRSAVLAVNDASLWARRATLLHRPTELAIPHALSDGSPRWEVLARGMLQLLRHDRGAGRDSRVLELEDDWSARLSRPAGTPWAVTAEGLRADPGAWLRVGDEANRSRERYDINGRSVYVIEPGGVPWSVGEALDALAAFASIGLATDLLTAAQRTARLPVALDLTGGLGDVLRALLNAAGWMVQAQRWRVGGETRGTGVVVPADAGRPFVLPWDGGDGAGGVSRVGRVEIENRTDPPRRWVMRGDRPIVEATFALVPGWDPALAGLADSEYGRSTSSDFSRYGAVYRHWVLNEDGAFDAAPFSQGPAYDLAALFRDALVVPAPTPVGDCLARDGSGRRLGPIVEVSTDSGATWSRYTGEAAVMRDRAGVVLDDAVLPAGVLSSAKSGQLRVRVTGTLRSPRALERSRWRGNPFAGAGPERVIEAGGAYRWARVDASSIHADALDLGELEADEVDDRRALESALLEQVARGDDEGDASGRVELIGAWPTLGAGDRLSEVGGLGLDSRGVASAVSREALRVSSVRVRFGVADEPPLTWLGLG